MKNGNVFGVHGKIRFLGKGGGGGGYKKPISMGGLSKKGGLDGLQI